MLKGVNSTTLDSTRDIGRDADSLRIITGVDSFRYNPNQYVAKDVFGYTLGYYANDFSSIRTYTTEKYFDLGQSSSTFYAGSPDLYNGNICRMVTAIAPFMQGGAAPIGKAFQYDQLNRLKSADVFTNANMSGNYWNTTGTADGRWAETFSYDANGNITKLKRRGHKVDTLAMDSLDYYYTSNTNQLDYVDDYVPAGNYSNDIDDQASNNYDYDAIGNLIKDTKEEIHDINWTVYGKIQNIIRITASEKPNFSFGYTPDGHRSMKSVITDSTWGANRSIYVHDAQGNIMAVYSMPTIKLLDTAGLDFEAINNQLLDQIGNTAFAEFVVDDLDIISLMAANGNYDVPGDYRTAIYTISGALEEALLLTLDPVSFFDVNAGLLTSMLTNDYTGVEVMDVLLVSRPLSEILTNVVNSEYNNPAFYNHILSIHGNAWLTALYTYNATDFETFYMSAMTAYGTISGVPGQSYAYMENDLNNNLTSGTDLENAMATDLGNSYTYNAFYSYFSSIDVNQMLNSYAGFKAVVIAYYGENNILPWAASYDLEKLWTAALNYQTLDDVLDWYQANEVTEFLKKCVAIHPDFVSELLDNTTMTNTGYLALIKSHLGTPVFKELCAGLRETYFRPGTEYSLAEWHLYGSSRLGIYQANKSLATYYDSTLTTITYQTRIQYRTNGSRRFELSNHLGNVLATVSDKRIAVCTLSETIAYYKAEVITASDYYSFGSIMEGRYYEADTNGYRFGWNGKLSDNEINGRGNTIAFEARIFDSRTGRFYSVDPLQYIQPFQSSYCYAGNQPIWAVDACGMVKIIVIEKYKDENGKITESSREVYNKPTAEELAGKVVSEITLTIHTKTILVCNNPGISNCNGASGLTVSTEVVKKGGLDDRQRVYEVNFLAGLAFDFVRLGPAGEIAEGITGKDMADNTTLSSAEAASKMISGAISMMSFGGSKSFYKLVIEKMSSKLEDKILEGIAEGMGIEPAAALKLVWGLQKLAKSASLNSDQVKSISANLVTALKAGKKVTDFMKDLSNQYQVDLDVDYETIDEAVSSEIQKYAPPASDFKQKAHGYYEQANPPN